jgi:hypothetical protein
MNRIKLKIKLQLTCIIRNCVDLYIIYMYNFLMHNFVLRNNVNFIRKYLYNLVGETYIIK